MTLKLTPTTNDQLAAMKAQSPNGGLKITPPHEPVKDPGVDDPWASVGLDNPFGVGMRYAADRQLEKMQEQKQNVEPTKPVYPGIGQKVALIGTAPSSRMLAPFNDPSWKIWGCSPGNMNALPRVDAWFEVHGSMLWPENRHYGENYLAWLKQQPFPIYMQNQSFIPTAISIPYRELVKEFGPYFFTSSFAWMMAFAIYTGAKEIMLFGIDMASRDEYILQRPGAFYFFMEAKRRGVKITAPYESDIMQPPTLYGFSEVTQFGRKLLARKAELNQRIVSMRQQRDNLSNQITYLEGAQEDADYFENIFGGVQNNSLEPDA
jgi:hypothetical protein